ncbi:hypothetical protein HC022_04410 [Salipiger sp. HF18]|uniref:phage holin family protein n=1 Tax=Salipiger sp. HF18 TaxID=2721557 RepID=UPI00142E0FE0|nr:phage holin family protein [Salipiger sp. HF18]NIY95519.1 hypothetical protein [Salipiger sp. HF18]
MFYALELRLRLLVRQLVFGALALVCVIVAAVFFTDAALVALAEAYDLLTAMLVVGGGYLVLAILLLLFARRPRVAVPPPTPAMNIAALLEAFLAGRAAGGAAGTSGSGTSQAGTARDDD